MHAAFEAHSALGVGLQGQAGPGHRDVCARLEARDAPGGFAR